jgi:ketosteroid isomerase-like protein
MTGPTVDPWIVDLFGAIDGMDAAAFAKTFAEDGTFRFANGEPAVGRQGLEQAVGGFFSMIGGLSHEITGVWTGRWQGGEVTSVEGEVTYTRQDGRVVGPLPVTSTIRRCGEEIQDYRIFMDVSPLYAAS